MSFDMRDILVIGVPVYAGRVPNNVVPASKIEFAERCEPELFFVCTGSNKKEIK